MQFHDRMIRYRFTTDRWFDGSLHNMLCHYYNRTMQSNLNQILTQKSCVFIRRLLNLKETKDLGDGDTPCHPRNPPHSRDRNDSKSGLASPDHTANSSEVDLCKERRFTCTHRLQYSRERARQKLQN